jgi:LysM repeat protein
MIRPMRAPACLLLSLLLPGCSLWPEHLFSPAQEGEPPLHVRIVPLDDSPLPPVRTASPQTRLALSSAQQHEAAAKQAGSRYQDRDRLLIKAQQAAAEGNNPRAQDLARQAANRASFALENQQTQQAATLLAGLYQTTGLSDAQLAAMRAAETALVRGETAAALKGLKAIKTSVQKPRQYVIQRGDTLSGIAARQSTYGNSLLWPLIWDANREQVPNPDRIRAGMTLKIRPSPTVAEVVAAIKTAREYPARVRIGKVKTVKP